MYMSRYFFLLLYNDAYQTSIAGGRILLTQPYHSTIMFLFINLKQEAYGSSFPKYQSQILKKS